MYATIETGALLFLFCKKCWSKITFNYQNHYHIPGARLCRFVFVKTSVFKVSGSSATPWESSIFLCTSKPLSVDAMMILSLWDTVHLVLFTPY